MSGDTVWPLEVLPTTVGPTFSSAKPITHDKDLIQLTFDNIIEGIGTDKDSKGIATAHLQLIAFVS